jgi:hypothetical protein
MSDVQRRDFHEVLLDATPSSDLPGNWQAAILMADGNRPSLRTVTS